MPSTSAALLLVLGLPPLLEHAKLLAQWDGDPPVAADADASTPSEPVAASDDGLPIVTSLDEILASAPATVVPARRTWVRHRIRPRERLTQIAARYGVRTEKIFKWNRLDPNKPFPKRRRRIRIHARRIPPPRVAVRYVVVEGDEWGDIAAKFRVENPDLRAWNWQRRSLAPGRELLLWVDPGAPQTLHPNKGPALSDTIEVLGNGQSKGYPDRGRLIDGVMLPDSDLYTKRTSGSGLYGSAHTIWLLRTALANFRHDTGFEGEVVVGAISRRKGGRFSPHLSHQSGRDVDVRLPRLPGVPLSTIDPNPDEVDWHATWALIVALADTGEVGRIFLDVELHRRLHEAARQLGVSREEIREILQWPTWNQRGNPIVRHSRGHTGHIHVRFRCGPDEPKCKARRRR